MAGKAQVPLGTTESVALSLLSLGGIACGGWQLLLLLLVFKVRNFQPLAHLVPQ